MLKRTLLLGPLFLLLTACSTTPPPKPAEISHGDYRYVQEYLRWMIEKKMGASGVTGMSIALVDDQRVVWETGFGYADAENGEAATANTQYRMGSIAKVLTASAAMHLAERDALSIDSPLAEALPGFSIKSRFGETAPITPRNIMTHHSGLPSNHLNGMVSSNPKYFATLVDDIKDEYVAYPPNYVFAYSNLGVTLLGAAIEQRSGMRYADYLDESLFAPLGMRDSYFASEPQIKGYNKGKLAQTLPLRDLPSGGLVSSVADMSRFMKMVFADGRVGDKQILSQASLAEMFRPQYPDLALDLGLRSGLGWTLSGFDVENGGIVAGHGGSLLNFHSMMVVLPEQRLGVVVAANSASALSLVNEVAETALKLALEAKSGIRQPARSHSAGIVTKLSEAEVESYAGYFDSIVGLVKINNNSGDLDADAMGHSFRLTSRDNGTFGIRYKLFGLIPVSVSAFDNISLTMERIAGRDVLVGRIGNEATLFGEKLHKPKIASALPDFVGRYEIVNLWQGGPAPENLVLRQEDGMFIAECTFAQMPGFILRIAVDPVSANEAVIAGIGPGRGETVRLLQVNDEKRMVFSGLELRKIN